MYCEKYFLPSLFHKTCKSKVSILEIKFRGLYIAIKGNGGIYPIITLILIAYFLLFIWYLRNIPVSKLSIEYAILFLRIHRVRCIIQRVKVT